MKVIAIVQARMSSERLPGKVLMQLNGKAIIQNIVERASKSKKIDKVILATSNQILDDQLYNFAVLHNIEVFRGSLDNVLERYYKCAIKYKADIIIRLTGDNPLIDSDILDLAVNKFQEKNIDYMRYCEQLPIGMHVEVFTKEALEKTFYETKNKECQEHVTLYMYRNTDKFKCEIYSDESIKDNSHLRWTVDTDKDYELMKCIYNNFVNNNFSYNDVLSLFERNPELTLFNANIKQRVPTYKM